MEIEHAKIILSNFRPDGQDADDSDFTEALSLAAQNRELGEWLASERSKDAVFSAALNLVEIPEGLREEILATINDDVIIEEDTQLDDCFFSAMASVSPPESLRDEILVAMDQESKVIKGVFSPWRVLPYAAAAVVALLAVFLFVPTGPAPTMAQSFFRDTDDARVHAYDVQQTVGVSLVKDNVNFVSHNLEDSMKWLEVKSLPVLDTPESLASMKCMGVTSVDIGEGQQGSLIRFLSPEDKEVNVLVIEKDKISNFAELPTTSEKSADDAYFCSNCDFWISRIHSGNAVVIILSQSDENQLAKIF